MRTVIQRVSKAAVRVDGKTVGNIGKGLVVLVGIGKGDGPSECRYMAEKITQLRIFEDADGKMNLSLKDTGGQALIVSQFTLYGDCSKGRRPSFTEAAAPEIAEGLYNQFVEEVRRLGIPVATGVFGAHMEVEIHNDGPVTFVMEHP